MRILFETENIETEDKFLAELMGLAYVNKRQPQYRRTVRKGRKVSISKRRNELRHKVEAKIQGCKTYFGYVELPKDFFKPDND